MSGESDAPFDTGLQAERTLLAWRRTCLAVAVACAVVVRFASEAIGPIAVVVGIAGIVGAAVGYIRASSRYRRAHDGLISGDELPIDGLALASVSFALLLAGIGAGVYVIGVGMQRL